MITTTVMKCNYEVFQFNGAYFGICKKGTYGGECVYGGDSADHDSYQLDEIEELFEAWEGTLIDGKIQYTLDYGKFRFC